MMKRVSKRKLGMLCTVLVLRCSLFVGQKREEQKELARMEMKPKRYKESRG
jgi:hypothetical protein